MKKSMILRVMLVGFFFICLCGEVLGQPAYPTRPIDIIVPYGPGGGTDMNIRFIAKYLSKTKNITINVINKPGGSGVIGLREVIMDAKPDGYTMVAETHGSASVMGAFNTDLPFDWRNRTWIAITDFDVVLYLVKYDSPWKTLKDIAEYIQKNPQKFRWGTAGRGGISAPAMGQFFQANNTSIEKLLPTEVIFNYSKDALVALAGGHVDFCAQQVAESYGLIEGKKIRPVAVVFEKRYPLLPELPTVADAGYPMLNVVGWHGVSGPPGLPKHVINFWTSSLEKASKDPVFNEMYEKSYKIPVFLGPQKVKEYVEEEYKRYLEIAKYFGWKK